MIVQGRKVPPYSLYPCINRNMMNLYSIKQQPLLLLFLHFFWFRTNAWLLLKFLEPTVTSLSIMLLFSLMLLRVVNLWTDCIGALHVWKNVPYLIKWYEHFMVGLMMTIIVSGKDILVATSAANSVTKFMDYLWSK